MRKHRFYTLCRTNDTIVARLVSGYSDGAYHYYHGTDKWHAVHPETGLAVCSGLSRVSVASSAHLPDIVDKIKRAVEQEGAAMKKLFEEKVAAAKQTTLSNQQEA